MQGRKSIDPNWKAIHEDGTDFSGDEHPAMVTLKTGQPVYNVLMGVYNPIDESHKWININSFPRFLNSEKTPDQVVATFEDITEIRNKTIELKS